MIDDKWSEEFLDALERVIELKQLHYSQKITFARNAIHLALTDFFPIAALTPFGTNVPLGWLLDIVMGGDGE